MKTIIWDIDDILNDLTRSWLNNAWLPAHPDCPMHYDILTQNPPHNLLGIDKTEYLVSLDTFRLSAKAEEMVPDAHVMEWFSSHGEKFRHIALTARPRGTVAVAIAWVLKHYGKWFQTFSYVPAQRPGEPLGHPDLEKHEFLSWLSKADVFIDDSPHNVEEAGKLGIQSFLAAQPWNNSTYTLIDILNGLII